MADRVQQVTAKMEILMKTFALMGQQLKELQEIVMKNVAEIAGVKAEQQAEKDRVSKLEQGMNLVQDRLRRANIRLRGFKGDFANNKTMIQNLMQWFKDNEIELKDHDIERAHWVFGARRDANQRDIIIKFAFERKAETVYKELRKIDNLTCNGAPIRVLKDLSVQTLQARSALRPITQALFKGNVRFTWQYPATIIIFQDGKVYRARSLEEGKKMLEKLGLDPDFNQQDKSTEEPGEKGATGDEAMKELFGFLGATSQGSGEEFTALKEKLALLESREKEIEDAPKEGRVTRQKKK